MWKRHNDNAQLDEHKVQMNWMRAKELAVLDTIRQVEWSNEVDYMHYVYRCLHTAQA